MASSCCWLPPLLLVFGVSGAGMIAVIEEYRPYMMVVTFSFLGMAFYFTYRPKRASAGQEDCCAPAAGSGTRRFNMMTMNKVMLWGVTALAIVFLFFPQLVTSLIASGTGEFIADMDRTIVRIVTSRTWGLPLMVLLLAIVFWLTISGANVPSKMLATLLMKGRKMR